MSQVPPPYDPTTDFSTIAQQPILTTGLPGTQLDAEFTNISTSVDATQARLGEIQRDDGKLRNGIVETYALAQDVLALLTTNGATIRGLWVPGESYNIGDLVGVLQPAFELSGVSGVGANGLYYVIGEDGGKPFFGKDGEQEYIFLYSVIRELQLGSTFTESFGWRLMKFTESQQYGMDVSGASSPSAVNSHYKVQNDQLCNGRQVYRSEFSNYVIVWNDVASRWEIRGDNIFTGTSADVQFQSTTATNFPNEASWVAVSGTGSITVGSSQTTEPGEICLIIDAANLPYPWNTPSDWIVLSALDSGIDVEQSTGGVGIVNASYISITDHVSADTFINDHRNWAIVGSPPSAGSLIVEDFTGDGVTVDYVLSSNPISETNTQIYMDGVYQSKSTYSLVGSIITFDSAPPNGVAIEVVSGIQVEVAIGSVSAGAIGTTELANDAVTTAKIQDGAITADKLAPDAIGDISLEDGSVTTAKLANSAVTAEKLAAGAFTTPKIADNAVTNAKMASSSVSTANIIDSNVTSAKLGTASVTEAKLGSDSVSTGKIQNNAVTGPKLAVGAAVANIGYSPVNKAGDTMSGTLNMGSNNILACPNVAKVHCVFQTATSGAAGTLVDDHNVTSVTRNGTGVYTVNFSSNVGSANHVTLVTLGARATAEITAKTATSVQITIRGVASGDPTDLTAGTQVNVVVFHS